MRSIGLLIAAALSAYGVWRLRGSAIAACVVPLVLTLGEAAFIQTWDWELSVPGLPVPLVWRDVVFVAVVAMWLWVRRRRRAEARLRPGVDLIAVAVFAGLALLQVPLAWFNDGSLNFGTLLPLRLYLYIPAGIALWLDTLRRFTRAELTDLIETLVALCVPLSALYILAMLGMPVYSLVGVSSVYSRAGGVVRDSLTFPYWLKLGIPYLLVKRRQTLRDAAVLALMLAAVMASYTRSLILAAMVVLALSIAYRLAKREEIARSIVVVGAGAALLAIAFLAVSSQYAENVAFLGQRLSELRLGWSQIETVGARAATSGRVMDYVASVDPVFGAGFARSRAAEVYQVFHGVIIGDVLWLPLIVFFGWSGVLSFAVLFGSFAASITRRLFTSAEASALAAAGMAVMAWDGVRAFASSEIVSVYAAGGMFLFALVAAEARGAWATEALPVERPLPSLSNLRRRLESTPSAVRLTVKAGGVVLVVLLEVFVGRGLAR